LRGQRIGSGKEGRVHIVTVVVLASVVTLGYAPPAAAQQTQAESAQQVRNKEIARAFYEDLWFSRNTDRFADYVADTYVVHDIGDRKGVTEPAVEQKNIADLFWKHGDLSGEIDFQIAEGDFVATRWRVRMEPRTLVGRILGAAPEEGLPIINVFRFEDGRIVEFWNHRHDIDSGQNLRLKAQGLGRGLLLALIPTGYAVILRGRLRGLTLERNSSGT
jgi:predicted SnoaL-like aldol condensation-catalyzing enzyme